jgi:hypothetical protein
MKNFILPKYINRLNPSEVFPASKYDEVLIGNLINLVYAFGVKINQYD